MCSLPTLWPFASLVALPVTEEACFHLHSDEHGKPNSAFETVASSGVAGHFLECAAQKLGLPN